MDKLEQILRTMDIPQQRMNDHKWLMRNLAIRNSEHKDLHEAMALIRKQDLDSRNKNN